MVNLDNPELFFKKIEISILILVFLGFLLCLFFSKNLSSFFNFPQVKQGTFLYRSVGTHKSCLQLKKHLLPRPGNCQKFGWAGLLLIFKTIFKLFTLACSQSL